VDQVVQSLLREGRIVWTGLSLRAKVVETDTDDSKWKMTQPNLYY